MKRILIFLSLFSCFAAGAQPRLVVQGIGDLVGDEYAPRYVVLTQDYVNSPEWQALDEKIDEFLSANMSYDDEPDEDDASFDWDGYIANLEEAIANFVREGDEAMAENYRQNLEEVKKYRAEVEDPEAHAEAVAQAEAAEQERQGCWTKCFSTPSAAVSSITRKRSRMAAPSSCTRSSGTAATTSLPAC